MKSKGRARNGPALAYSTLRSIIINSQITFSGQTT
jgi:hypothetical protein